MKRAEGRRSRILLQTVVYFPHWREPRDSRLVWSSLAWSDGSEISAVRLWTDSSAGRETSRTRDVGASGCLLGACGHLSCSIVYFSGTSCNSNDFSFTHALHFLFVLGMSAWFGPAWPRRKNIPIHISLYGIFNTTRAFLLAAEQNEMHYMRPTSHISSKIKVHFDGLWLLSPRIFLHPSKPWLRPRRALASIFKLLLAHRKAPSQDADLKWQRALLIKTSPAITQSALQCREIIVCHIFRRAIRLDVRSEKTLSDLWYTFLATGFGIFKQSHQLSTLLCMLLPESRNTGTHTVSFSKEEEKKKRVK